MKESELFELLGAIHRATPAGGNLEDAVKAIREEVRATKALNGPTKGAPGRALRGRLIRAFRPPKSVQTALKELQTTHVLEEKEANLVRRLKLLTETEDGHFQLRNPALTVKEAMLRLVLLSMLAGAVLCWIIVGPEDGLMLINKAFLAGACIGAGIGRVLDRSIRLWPLMTKLDTAAPWLGIRVQAS